jgi:hypothetical protein
MSSALKSFPYGKVHTWVVTPRYSNWWCSVTGAGEPCPVRKTLCLYLQTHRWGTQIDAFTSLQGFLPYFLRYAPHTILQVIRQCLPSLRVFCAVTLRLVLLWGISCMQLCNLIIKTKPISFVYAEPSFTVKHHHPATWRNSTHCTLGCSSLTRLKWAPCDQGNIHSVVRHRLILRQAIHDPAIKWVLHHSHYYCIDRPTAVVSPACEGCDN